MKTKFAIFVWRILSLLKLSPCHWHAVPIFFLKIVLISYKRHETICLSWAKAIWFVSVYLKCVHNCIKCVRKLCNCLWINEPCMKLFVCVKIVPTTIYARPLHSHTVVNSWTKAELNLYFNPCVIEYVNTWSIRHFVKIILMQRSSDLFALKRKIYCRVGYSMNLFLF